MAETYINAQDLVEDINLDGEEQFVMFDTETGKRAKLKNIKTYINDQNYDELMVRGADYLTGGSYVEESVPYKFRQTAGGIGTGGVKDECIVGGTIAWNQLVKNGNFADTSSWGYTSSKSTFTVSNNVGIIQYTAVPSSNYEVSLTQQFDFVLEHKYFLSVDFKVSKNTTFNIDTNGSLGSTLSKSVTADTWNNISKVLQSTLTNQRGIFLYLNAVTSGFQIGDSFQVKDMVLFDLTLMFGSTIADYIYSLETATAGAGVAYFKKLFPKPYYAYDAGTLKHVEGLVSHDTVGFNALDIENTYISDCFALNGTTLTNTQADTRDRFNPSIVIYKDTTPVTSVASETFYGTGRRQLVFNSGDYDGNRLFLKHNGSTRDLLIAITQYDSLVKNTNYCLSLDVVSNNPTSVGGLVLSDICINLAWDNSRNGEYEPYELHSYPLDSDLTLRGIPKLDSANNLYYDGDTYESDGAVNRKYGIVDLGTLTWGYAGSYFYATVGSKAFGDRNIICVKYPASASTTGVSGMQNKEIKGNSGANYLYITDSAFTDGAALKASLSGVYLVYELATPTTETASAYVGRQYCDEYGTEEFVSTSVVPVGHKTKYYDNLTKRIDKLPSAIAPLERTNKASANYAVGDYLILNNTLYKVTSAISSGGTITVGSNVTATTIMAEIKALR